ASGTNATLTSVAFAGPRGIAAGSGTVLWSETAGQMWEDRSPALLPAGFSERAFAAGSQLFLAGDGAPIAIAENGTTFAPGTVIGPDFGSVRAIVRHDDAYLAASARYDSGTGASRGYLLASHDGLWWEA